MYFGNWLAACRSCILGMIFLITSLASLITVLSVFSKSFITARKSCGHRRQLGEIMETLFGMLAVYFLFLIAFQLFFPFQSCRHGNETVPLLRQEDLRFGYGRNAGGYIGMRYCLLTVLLNGITISFILTENTRRIDYFAARLCP